MRVSFRLPFSSSLLVLQSLRFLIAFVLVLGWADRGAAQGIIYVTSLQDKISSSGGCSLQEAIYSATFHTNLAINGYDPTSNYFPNIITTECVAGSGNDRIILPSGAVFHLSKIVEDKDNPFGPTATPIVTSNITIEANGSLLQWVGTEHARAFAVGSTGNLTIRNAYIKSFTAKGGDGANGGGGGMGAGGAIYVKGSGGLTVENSTFDSNGAIGGNGAAGLFGGGGGGLAGNGGSRSTFSGGGGGGSRGNGGKPEGSADCSDNCLHDPAGGGGGGTVAPGGDGGIVIHTKGGAPGFMCGGNGGDAGDNGQDGTCPGGGGGGAGFDSSSIISDSADGGQGGYGGGGGGGNVSGTGGGGGFGGGGGSGDNGGNGGFGGGGGAAQNGDAGKGGLFGGNATSGAGGGGAGLGGAIFNDGGSVTIQNSTFTSNFVDRGVAIGAGAVNGADAGGAIFSLNGHLSVESATISGNQSTGSGGGIVVFQTFADPLPPTSFTLNNTIIANNGPLECAIDFFAIGGGGAGNLIQNNAAGQDVGFGKYDPCPGVVTNLDPQLGPLQVNQLGLTPTMAIPRCPTTAPCDVSPAYNTADPNTSLATDQRGVDRPQVGLPDIGAFELCVSRDPSRPPCDRFVILPPPDTEPLTTQVSPAAGGTVNPAAGTYSETVNSVIVLTATPNLGYGFVNWIGAVADPSNSSTTVTMDQPQTVTANFAPLPTSMAGNIIAKAGPQSARVWTLSLLDNGPGVANGTTIHDFMLTQTFGAACTPVVSNAAAFPLSLGNLAPGQKATANVTLDFTGCATSARFTAKFTYSANSGAVSGFVLRYNQYQ